MTVETLRPLGWKGRVESVLDHIFHVDPFEWTEARLRELGDAIEEWDNEGGARSPQAGTGLALPERPPGVPEYVNDLGVGGFRLVRAPSTASGCRRPMIILTYI